MGKVTLDSSDLYLIGGHRSCTGEHLRANEDPDLGDDLQHCGQEELLLSACRHQGPIMQNFLPKLLLHYVWQSFNAWSQCHKKL